MGDAFVIEGLLIEHKMSLYLPWLKWPGIALSGCIIASDVGLWFGFNMLLSIFLSCGEIPAVLAITGTLVNPGFGTQYKQGKIPIDYQLQINGNRRSVTVCLFWPFGDDMFCQSDHIGFLLFSDGSDFSMAEFFF